MMMVMSRTERDEDDDDDGAGARCLQLVSCTMTAADKGSCLLIDDMHIFMQNISYT